MSIFKNILSFGLAFIISILTVGINITDHTCNTCGIHEKDIHVFNIEHSSEHNHSDIQSCSVNKICCESMSNRNFSHHSHSSKCCDFDNEYLKILHIFSPKSELKLFVVNFIAIDILFFANPTQNIIPDFVKKYIYPLKISLSDNILQKKCTLIL